jgi:hypothetical protein
MIKDAKNKAIGTGKAVPATRIKCVRECWAVGLGKFNVGDVIENDVLVAELAGNPNFVEIKEEA